MLQRFATSFGRIQSSVGHDTDFPIFFVLQGFKTN